VLEKDERHGKKGYPVKQ